MTLRRTPQDNANTPGALASELAQARASFATRRQSVIDRGTKRAQELDALQKEIIAERDAHIRVVGEAQASKV